nr:maleylpyruvate isomerase N-terminal domain-containing protein [Streptomyces sp. SID5469]
MFPPAGNQGGDRPWATSRGIELLVQAHAYLRGTVAAGPEQAWGAPTPCGEWTVRQVLSHARLDQQAYGAAVTGDGRPESDSFAPADALSGDARAELDAVLRRVADVYTALPADAEQVPTPLGPLLQPPWTPACTPGTSPWRRAWTCRWTRRWPTASGPPRSVSRIIFATRTGCSLPCARCPKVPAGPRRCSPFWAGIRTGRLPRPDPALPGEPRRPVSAAHRGTVPRGGHGRTAAWPHGRRRACSRSLRQASVFAAGFSPPPAAGLPDGPGPGRDESLGS